MQEKTKQRIKDTQELLRKFNIPELYVTDLMALSFLSLLTLDSDKKYSAASSRMMRIHDILKNISDVFSVDYAENSRETVRKRVIRVLEQSALIERNPDDPTRPTNSGKTVYQVTDEALEIVKKYQTKQFDKKLEEFFETHTSLKEQYAKKRELHRIPLVIDGEEFTLSSGTHNELQVSIIEDFASRFAHGSKLLYVGDTENKYIYVNKEKLEELGIPISENDKLQLPDVVLYDETKNWLYLIEAVTTHGPIDQKRIIDLEKMFENCSAGNVYVTAFPDRPTFRKYIAEIAWETEVWISSEPDHMIHFNGDRFMGPH
ncbi:MAG: BsuBI/PstI family type II restriction endonuclease [Arcobacter sp.]|uniref:BsuBI/PstI family type II restriction endonuclease n=1 Tax=Arcobacter sp. TaxID=1872629 RepID=UPI002A1FB10B|nr:BsuBI/PstI family type II restriction endonuclease [Aliarcobacter cryaerophilus]